MPSTPIYGIPYAGLSDQPHGPNQQQALANAVETQLARMDTQPVIAIFTSNGNYVKPTNLKAVKVTLVAGGGGGGSGITTGASQGAAGGGGGGGQTCVAYIPAASLPSSVAVGIGAGGAISGGNGANSTFGTLITANAGQGGTNQPSAYNSGAVAGGAGGTGVGGSWSPVARFDGENGDVGRVGGGEPQPAEGGASGLHMGAGGRQGSGVAAQIPGSAGKLYGGGGGGGANRASISPGGAGAVGAAGVCIVESLF